MLRFRGSPALSPFRLQKLLVALWQRVPAVTDVYAEFIHFVDGSLTTHDRELLDRLLCYGPAALQRHLHSEPTFLVIPRPGALSPKFSNAPRGPICKPLPPIEKLMFHRFNQCNQCSVTSNQ